MIPTGRDRRMTQEVGSSCSTPWLFFQTFWSFCLPSLIYTNNGFSWKKQHRKALTYKVIDQRKGSVTSWGKNRECAISFFPVAFYYKVVSSTSSKFSHTCVKANFFFLWWLVKQQKIACWDLNARCCVGFRWFHRYRWNITKVHTHPRHLCRLPA